MAVHSSDSDSGEVAQEPGGDHQTCDNDTSENDEELINL